MNEETGDAVQTWLVAFTNDDMEAVTWFVGMTNEQAGEVETMLEEKGFGDPYVTTNLSPISFETFKADSGLFDEEDDE